MFAKSDVNGENANPVFKYLRRHSRLYDSQKGTTRVIPWNFTKFIVSSQFTDIEYLNPRTESAQIQQTIATLLAK